MMKVLTIVMLLAVTSVQAYDWQEQDYQRQQLQMQQEALQLQRNQNQRDAWHQQAIENNQVRDMIERRRENNRRSVDEIYWR